MGKLIRDHRRATTPKARRPGRSSEKTSIVCRAKVAGPFEKTAVVEGLSAAGLPFGKMDDDSQATQEPHSGHGRIGAHHIPQTGRHNETSTRLPFFDN